ncbi:M2 family metallopeptidase [Massilia sp. TS11]|uniref:M2 family metallopeptidase n=1 Tax=Massilia sp. TS11 TaxID=2908003 RepID=UPI001EDAFD47|nr:M2 family metallopeptidase [Massilia sp. TS11]MCG2584131.1 M2 family metallopeptidase [Massilia sp. TS11]
MQAATLRVLVAAAAMSLAGWAQAAKPTVADAEKFVKDAEARLEKLAIDAGRAEWVAENFITDDTEVITAQAGERYLTLSGELALKARQFNGLKLPEATARKLKLLQLSLMFSNAEDRADYTRLLAKLTGAYGKGKYCPKDGNACMPLGELEKILAESRDPARLKEVWLGWHNQAASYKDDYVKYTALSNKGAREMGFADTGAFWRSNYDMPPAQFASEMERIWQQVKPLYDALHTYTRYKLRETYGPQVVPASGPIPAHLFGNMWSQSWENLYPLLKPAVAQSSYDLSKVLESRKTSAVDMTKYAERFYTSLGMETLPKSFWERSLLTKPRDREVVCHASAWDIDGDMDVRIKMCITPTAEEFSVIHHELGHIYYDLGYRKQSFLFKNGANDGFHEAIGDTVALSITPDYLQKIGLMTETPDPAQDIGPLLQRALAKVAFLPFAYTVDSWRWQVYGGQVKPADYDKAWWALREKYQGMMRPEPISANGFDAGAKFHVASDTPYARYFLAHMLQFQFHRALCREAGYTGPLHRCSIYDNKKAGAKFQAMLQMGASKPWPEALKAVTGEDRIDGGALLEYFAPLKAWLDTQNQQLAAADKARNKS